MDEATTPEEEARIAAADFAAGRLLWARLLPDPERAAVETEAAWADFLTGDDAEDAKLNWRLLESLVMDGAYHAGNGARVPAGDDDAARTAERLIQAETRSGPDDVEAGWKDDLAAYWTGDEDEDLERWERLIEALITGVAGQIGQVDPEPLEYARVQAWRRAPAEARFAAAVFGRDVPTMPAPTP